MSAAKLRYPKSEIRNEGKFRILYTGDSAIEGNRNLMGDYGAYNFSSRKIRTPFDFMREYLELVNNRIKEFAGGLITIEQKEKLKDFLLGNTVVKKINEQPLEFSRVDTSNGNNYSKLVQQYFPEKYSQVCLLNYTGIAKNLQKFMKSINDNEGLEKFKNHYGIKVFDLKNGRIGFRTDLSLEELKSHGLSESWLNPPKTQENKIKTRQISQKSPSNDEMNF